jgi:flagellin-like protein
MKGISPIIATIVILLVTIVIAGAAWAYISGYFGGMVSKGVEITSIDCTTTGVKIYLHNIGSDNIDTAADIEVTKELVAGACTSANMQGTYIPVTVPPGGTTVLTDAGCLSTDPTSPVPRYTIVAGGRVQHTQVNC